MKTLFSMLTLSVLLVSYPAKAADLEQTIMVSAAGSLMCKIYAEEVGADQQPFIDMSAHVIQVAEKLGYTNDFQSFTRDVQDLKATFEELFSKQNKSKLDIYNESPRLCRRLIFLRELAYEQTTWIFPRSA